MTLPIDDTGIVTLTEQPNQRYMKELVPQEVIEQKICVIRGQKVMLDKDLARLYGVTTGNLNKAVNRNIDRFPEDFMFRLTNEEFKNSIFHFGTSSCEILNVSPKILCFN